MIVLPLTEHARKVVLKIDIIHHAAGAVPDHFLRDRLSERHDEPVKRTGNEFDPNVYFTVLSHLSLPEDKRLAYWYADGGIGGEPILHLQDKNDSEVWDHFMHEDWIENLDMKPWRALSSKSPKNNKDALNQLSRLSGPWRLSDDANFFTKLLMGAFLRLDGSPESFFELAVFLNHAGQFYLDWHACYYDLSTVTSMKDFDNLPREAPGLDDEWKAEARIIIVEPSVEMGEDLVRVTYCTFTGWGGLRCVKDTFRRTFPHLLVGREIIAKLDYDCGICY